MNIRNRPLVRISVLSGRNYDFVNVYGDLIIERRTRVADKVVYRRVKHHDLVLDLNEVRTTDMSAVAAIISIFKDVRKSKRRMYVCGANNYLINLCSIAGLDDFEDIEFHSNVNSALSSLSLAA